MIVYVVTRDEVQQSHNGKNRTAVWNPFLSLAKAIAMVESHVAFRIRDGATVQTRLVTNIPTIAEGAMVRSGGSDSKPTLTPAPQLTCSCYEVNLLRGNERTQYRVIQMPIQE